MIFSPSVNILIRLQIRLPLNTALCKEPGTALPPLTRSGFFCCPSTDYCNLLQLFSPSPRGDTEQLEAAFWGDYNAPRGRSGGKKLKSKGLNDLERQRSLAAVPNAHSTQQCGAAPGQSCRAHGAARIFFIFLLLLLLLFLIRALFFSLYQPICTLPPLRVFCYLPPSKQIFLARNEADVPPRAGLSRGWSRAGFELPLPPAAGPGADSALY